jgi:equilibrative nucleoside transporter 1/2/3
MDRIRKTFKSQPTYAPINTEAQDDDSESYVGSNESLPPEGTAFSWIEYSIFMLLGVAMLWAW